jgi:hypoxanthine phosphoribosyltransferase
VSIHDDVEEILLDADTIAERVAELGAEVTEAYLGRDPGARQRPQGGAALPGRPHAGDADAGQRRPDGGLELRLRDRDERPGPDPQGPVAVDRRPARDHRRGHHRHRPDAELPAAYIADKGPASVAIVCLLDKPARRLAEIPIDYRGFTIPDRFVVGYGLDYDERYRNLPYIGVLKPSVYGGEPPEG